MTGEYPPLTERDPGAEIDRLRSTLATLGPDDGVAYPRGESPRAITERSLLARLVADAYRIVAEAIEVHIADPGKRLTAEVVLYSGGDDSTVLAHIFRRDADYAAHINTGIFVMDEETGESAAEAHVRATCAQWDLPLIVDYPSESYRDLVIAHGFPGPPHHYKMYQRLKERGLRRVRGRLVKHSRRERVLFIAGRRREESDRRAEIPAHEREGSIVWASPLVHWTKADLHLYRKHHPDLPRNPVAEEIHMSGECLCGAFAKPGEMAQLELFRPRTAAMLRDLQADVLAAGNCHPERATWGWGAFRKRLTVPLFGRMQLFEHFEEPPAPEGKLCSSCTFDPTTGREDEGTVVGVQAAHSGSSTQAGEA